jgi:hypothetical protein
MQARLWGFLCYVFEKYKSFLGFLRQWAGMHNVTCKNQQFREEPFHAKNIGSAMQPRVYVVQIGRETRGDW